MIDLATWQHILDRRNNELLNQLHEEILDYDILKRQWGYGHIEIRTKKCKLGECTMYEQIHYRTAFYGHYVNIHNQKRKVYLGFSFKYVFLHLDGKKSSLFGPYE